MTVVYYSHVPPDLGLVIRFPSPFLQNYYYEASVKLYRVRYIERVLKTRESIAAGTVYYDILYTRLVT